MKPPKKAGKPSLWGLKTVPNLNKNILRQILRFEKPHENRWRMHLRSQLLSHGRGAIY
jgi:hypothetical protein